MNVCLCPETSFFRSTTSAPVVKPPIPVHHNCDYVRRRNRLVGLAVTRASRCVNRADWQRVYVEEMQALVEQHQRAGTL